MTITRILSRLTTVALALLFVSATLAHAQTWTLGVSASPAAGGTACCEFGGSTAYVNVFTLTASANPGYRFTNWTENGVVVSTSASYSFDTRTARTLVANFAAENTNSSTAFSITGSVTGPLTSQTITASVDIPSTSVDAGQSIEIYIAANVGNTWFFKGPSDSWTPWSGGSIPAPYISFNAPLNTNSSFGVSVVRDMDLTSVAGAEIYVGYGRNQADMMSNAKYRKVATVAAPTPTPTPTPTACTYWIRPTSQTFDASGGYGTVDVLQNETSCLVPNPPWAVTSNTSWITNVYPGSLSNGQGPAYYYVEPNTSTSPRTGTVTVAGNTHTVTQSGGSANPFQGSFSGRWSGTCYGSFLGGTFTMDIAADGSVSGSYSGPESGGISGTVSTSGGLSAHGTGAGGISWSGTFTGTGTTRRGSGSWTLESDCSGTWSTQ